jgi:hypothetical protein
MRFFLLLVCGILACPLCAAPLPTDKGNLAPRDAKGISLRIFAHERKEKILNTKAAFLPVPTIDIALCNTNDKPIELKNALTCKNMISRCGLLEFVCWFPDKSITYFQHYDYLPQDSLQHSLLLKQNTILKEPYNYSHSFRTGIKLNEYRLRGDYRSAYELVRDNKGRFCMTALLNVNGTYIQSNTLRFNGCPLPPRDFDPMDASPYTPRGAILQEERMQKRNQEAERAMREAEARYRLLRFND